MKSLAIFSADIFIIPFGSVYRHQFTALLLPMGAFLGYPGGPAYPSSDVRVLDDSQVGKASFELPTALPSKRAFVSCEPSNPTFLHWRREKARVWPIPLLSHYPV